MDALDLLANNLANVNTAGFKEQRAFFSLMERLNAAATGDELAAVVNNRPVLGGSVLDLSNGAILPTGRDLDLALVGQGFLSIQSPGGVRYSRNGNLTTNSRGQLVTSEGFPVLGEKGAITLGPGKVEMGENGDVRVNSVFVDRLKLVGFPDTSRLQREGNSLFLLPPGSPEPGLASETSVRQGFIEQSNVNPMTATVRMVEIMRHFEAIQKSLNLVSNVLDAKSIEKLSR